MLVLFQVMIDALTKRHALVRLVHFSVLEYNDDLNDLYRRHLQHILQDANEYLARWPEFNEASAVDNRVAIFAFIAAFAALKDFYPILAGDHFSTESLEQAASACADAWHAALAAKSEKVHNLSCLSSV
jgi:hypothetical protein